MGEEIALFNSAWQYGPVYVALLLLFVFINYKLWPWWTGPRQELMQQRWQAQQDASTARDTQTKDLTDRVLIMFEKTQNGAREENRADHTDISKMIAETHQATMAVLTAHSTEDERRLRKIEEWITTLVMELEDDADDSSDS